MVTTAEVEARTYSTLSSAVRLRASAASDDRPRVMSRRVATLRKTVIQLGFLLSTIERLDFNAVRDQEGLKSLQPELTKLHQLIGTSLDWLSRHDLPNEYAPLLSILASDHERLASIIGDFALYFNADFRESLRHAVKRTGPTEERFMDWRTRLASLSD